jgi:hypothetical protein
MSLIVAQTSRQTRGTGSNIGFGEVLKLSIQFSGAEFVACLHMPANMQSLFIFSVQLVLTTSLIVTAFAQLN